ncbi:hypothetical protein Drorol1_Dr00003699 [Drosera rotundifolia]
MLVKLFGHRNQSVLYPALQAAIVLTAGDEFRIQRMINDKVLPRLVNLLTNDYEMRIKNDACWVNWNITISEWQKEESLKVCLQGLENILKAGEYKKNLGSSGDDNVYAHKIKEAGGVRMMRKLLNGDGDEIHQMAARILEEYVFNKKKIMLSVD